MSFQARAYENGSEPPSLGWRAKKWWRNSQVKEEIDEALGFEYESGDRVIREHDGREFEIEDSLTALSVLTGERGYKILEPAEDGDIVEADYVPETELSPVK